MKAMLDSLWIEGPDTLRPSRVRRDYAVVGTLMAAVLIEGVVRQDMIWRPATVSVSLALILTLLWRRSQPLAMLAIATGGFIVFDLVRLVATGQNFDLYSATFIFILVYALFRWASSRDVLIGSGVLLIALLVSFVTNYSGVGDAVGGTSALFFFGALGVSVRYRHTARLQQLEQVKLEEREQVARELHDSVAHHVSAIAIQAQAGLMLAKSASLPGAIDALEIIEKEASKTLSEMRSIVGALRHGDTQAELVPQPKIVDIAQLSAAGTRDSPQIGVELLGDLDQLRPAMETAIYRLAQESVTNAIRHARGATRVDVRVVGRKETVQLTVSDDGRASAAVGSPTGYGIVGMVERASLLGGVLEAGPGTDRGWTVSAVLPKQGKTR